MRLGKSKQPIVSAQPAVSTPAPAEAVRDLTSRRDPKALAASSAAIALSIFSAFTDSHDAFTDSHDASGYEHVVPGRVSAWMAGHGAVRIAVESAKESSDTYPLPKAVIGAVSVLMRNFDVGLLCP